MLAWWLALVGCVVAFDETVKIEAPVDRIAVEVAAGDVRVLAGPSKDVLLMGTFGGAGGRPLGHTVKDGLLTVSYDCRLCGGELRIEAPPEVGLQLSLGAGDLTVQDMAGLLTAEVSAGSAALYRHQGTIVDLIADLGDAEIELEHPPDTATAPYSVEVEMGTGDLDLRLPAGAYDLQLQAGAGEVSVDGVIDDPDSPHTIRAVVAVGSIEVSGP